MTNPTFTSRVEMWLFSHRLGFLILFLMMTAVLFLSLIHI